MPTCAKIFYTGKQLIAGVYYILMRCSFGKQPV